MPRRNAESCKSNRRFESDRKLADGAIASLARATQTWLGHWMYLSANFRQLNVLTGASLNPFLENPDRAWCLLIMMGNDDDDDDDVENDG